MTHEFNLQIRTTDLPHDFDQQEWATRMTYELDPRESRDLAHFCISLLGRSHCDASRGNKG